MKIKDTLTIFANLTERDNSYKGRRYSFMASLSHWDTSEQSENKRFDLRGNGSDKAVFNDQIKMA
ncbi:hypothetical protein ABD76_26685 [Paenibacillus dendritiformis]|nr:hypothetical protein [Paenibacillus dendritiformis]